MIKKLLLALLCVALILLLILSLKKQDNMVDLIVFAGQSNMAGRGATSEQWPEGAPAVAYGTGWEFRAISDPTKLYPLAEPFGLNENNATGINDVRDERLLKTGSMVSAFVNAYYAECKVPVVAVSASKGGSGIAEWVSGSVYLNDLLARLDSAKRWLTAHGYGVRRTLCVWCQGETDGDNSTPPDEYTACFDSMLDAMTAAGVERLLMVRTGQCNAAGKEDLYQPIIELQTRIAAEDSRVSMVSELLAGMRERGLMKDSFHYYQQGYNEVGADAGKNAALLMK